MLVKCPRCGFQQPQDQYCAQCGVDMTAYRAPKPSAFKKVLTNPAVQIAVVLAIAGTVGLSLYKKRNLDLEDRVNYLKGGVQISRSVSSPESADGTADLSADVAARDAAANAASFAKEGDATAASTGAAAGAAKALAPGSDAAKTTAAGNPTAGTKAASTTAVVHIYGMEVSRQALSALYEDSQATGQFNSFGDHVAGIIPNVKQRNANSGGMREIWKSDTPIGTGTANFFTGIRLENQNSDIGMTFFISVEPNRDGLYEHVGKEVITGNLEVTRDWMEASAAGGPVGVQKTTFPALFELAPGSGFFLSGIMPRATLLPANLESELVSKTLFQILRSQEFRSRNSEFVLFFEFDRN